MVSDEKPKMTVAAVQADAEVMLKLATALEPFEREAQLRILEAVCVMLGNDEHAAMFRNARRG